MFQTQARRSTLRTIFGMAELVYHSIVRDVRKSHRNALVGLGLTMVQSVLMVLTIYLMYSVFGMKSAPLRGDFFMYIMSGVMPFLMHTKAVTAIAGAEGPSSPMMHHAPMNTTISILAASFSTLYLQMLSIIGVLSVYHVTVEPVVIDNPIGALMMLFAAWISGVGVGILFLAVTPWAPDFANVASSIYARVSMIGSGKLFVANTLPTSILVMFDWNPLFHAVDQSRGYVFLHYNPHFSSPTYPFYVAIGLIVFGMMAEFYTRKHASISWSAGN